MKDLFVGALGRVNNHGGSRIYTTPNTVKVEPEYSIDVSYNIQGGLVAYSLDGRLWLYRRSRRLGVIALRWSKENSKLEYAAAKNFSNNDDVVLVRGLDWVLTNNNIFMVSDSEPYILQSPLFVDDVQDTYLYSFLRAKGVGASGVDPFTNEAWGKREDNGNTEGTGYFSKSTHLLYLAGTHSMEHCYSLLPAVGDWQIVENFLVRRPDAESLDSYNYMQSMRPLIPLELWYGSEPLYGTGYNFDHRGIQLACVNGQLWGRGARNIGKVYILPAVFTEDGSVQEYYLYISPDYVCMPETYNINTGAYAVFEDHTFILINNYSTWINAKNVCETLGGHLATSISSEKNSFLTSVADGVSIWLNGTDEDNEGTWTWDNGENWSYTNWATNQPDNARSNGGEHYLELWSDGTWNDASASQTNFFICEWDSLLEESDINNIITKYNQWSNIAILHIDDNSIHGFLSQQVSPVTGGLCEKAQNTSLFNPQTKQWDNLSENNGSLFVDVVSSRGIVLDETGMKFLKEGEIETFTCATLPQWVAPAGKVEAVDNDSVVASTDNAVLRTSLVTGFNRELITPNTLPLSGTIFEGSGGQKFRVAVYEDSSGTRKAFGVNRLVSKNAGVQNIPWENVYKNAVSIEKVGLFVEKLYEFDIWDAPYHACYYPIFVADDRVTSFIIPGQGSSLAEGEHLVEVPYYLGYGFDAYGSYRVPSFYGTCTTDFFYYSFEAGEVVHLTISADFSCYTPYTTTTSSSGVRYRHYHPFDDHSHGEVPQSVGISDGKLGYFYRAYIGGYTNDEYPFRPCIDCPDEVLQWIEDTPRIILQRVSLSPPVSVFTEKSSQTTLLCDTPSIEAYPDATEDARYWWPSYLNFWKKQSNEGLHIANFDIGSEEYVFLIFRSQLHPEIFDFDAELERSKLS